MQRLDDRVDGVVEQPDGRLNICQHRQVTIDRKPASAGGVQFKSLSQDGAPLEGILSHRDRPPLINHCPGEVSLHVVLFCVGD